MASPALDPDVQAFRMPAEWEEHEATWLGWPHNLSDWPGRFAPIPWVYGEIVRKLAEGEIVRILLPSKAHELKARRVLERVGAATGRLEFFRWPTDRGWTRDFGPVCVRREHPEPEVAVARFRFSGWAKYPDHRKDDQVSERAAKALDLQLRRAVHKGRPVVLEGGAIDVDGKGHATENVQHVARELAQRGVPVGPPRAFTRPVTLPSGVTEEARFSTLTLDPSVIDYGRVYFCQHGSRHLVWRDEFREHPNGVVGLAAVVIAAENPDGAANVYRSMFGAGAVRPIVHGFTLAAGLGRVDILERTAAARRFGPTPGDESPIHMKALVLRSRSLQRAKAVIGASAGAFGDRLLVSGEQTFGAVIEFVA